MSTWYRTSKYGWEIKTALVVSETTKFITIETTGWQGKKYQRRTAKQSDYDDYFHTREEAVEALIHRGELTIELAKAKINETEIALAKLRAE